MHKKLFFIILFSLIISLSCSTSQKWTKKDFAKYAKSKKGSKKFYLKYYGHAGGLAYGTWIYQNWSEYKKSISFYKIKDKVEYGKTNQMQIHIETHILGPTATIWLRIKNGKPDKDGLYKFLNVVEEKIDLPFSGNGCNLKQMAVSIKKIPKLLKAKKQ